MLSLVCFNNSSSDKSAYSGFRLDSLLLSCKELKTSSSVVLTSNFAFSFTRLSTKSGSLTSNSSVSSNKFLTTNFWLSPSPTSRNSCFNGLNLSKTGNSIIAEWIGASLVVSNNNLNFPPLSGKTKRYLPFLLLVV